MMHLLAHILLAILFSAIVLAVIGGIVLTITVNFDRIVAALTGRRIP